MFLFLLKTAFQSDRHSVFKNRVEIFWPTPQFRAPKCPCLRCSFLAPRITRMRRKAEAMISMRVRGHDVTRGRRNTSLHHADPPPLLLYGDGSALNAARCLVPGCIRANESILLRSGGQSTYRQFRE